MIHYLLTLTPAQDLKTKAWDKGWRCWCVSCASHSCPCPHTPCEPSLLPSLLSSDSWEHLLALSQSSSQHWISSRPHLSALPSVYSAFPVLPWQISFAFLPEHYHPLGCDGVFTWWQHILSSALPHLWGSCLFPSLPKGSHGCRHGSLICTAPDRPVQPPRWDDLVLCLWRALLTAAVTSLTLPVALTEQHKQVPGRGLVLCAWHRSCTPFLPTPLSLGTLPNSPMQPRAAVTVLPAGELTGSNLGTDSSAPRRSKGGFQLGSSPSTPPHCHPLLSKEAAWGCT